MPLSTNELQILRAFFGRPEGKLWVGMLEGKLAAVDVQLRTATGEQLYRHQGRAQQLDELIRELTEADEKLKRPEPSTARPVRNWTQP